MFVGLALGPFVIHRTDTLAVCGNDTYTPSPSPAHFEDWSSTINDQMFYYLLAQAVVAFILLFWTLFGKLNFHTSLVSPCTPDPSSAPSNNIHLHNVAFPNAPPTPPSLSRELESKSEHVHTHSVWQHIQEFFQASIKSFKNIHFVLFLIVSGMYALVLLF